MANLNNNIFGQPVVWVVRKEYTTEVYFEQKNAIKAFLQERKRIKEIEAVEELCVLVDDYMDGETNIPLAMWRRGDGAYITISVNYCIVRDSDS